MKKYLLLGVLVVCIVSVSFAQFGIKAGLVGGSFTGDDKQLSYGFDPQINKALAAGLTYNIHLFWWFSLQPEVMYIQRGGVYENDAFTNTYKLDYAEVPVALRFTIPLLIIDVFAEGGASYGWLVSAKLKEETPTSTDEYSIKDGMTKNDLLYFIGGGVRFLFLEADARYMVGQRKLLADNDMKIYNRDAVVTVGIVF